MTGSGCQHMVVVMDIDTDSKEVQAAATAMCRYVHLEAFVGILDHEPCAKHLHMAAVVVEAIKGVDVEECDYSFSHTRHWCGNPGCRDS